MKAAQFWDWDRCASLQWVINDFFLSQIIWSRHLVFWTLLFYGLKADYCSPRGTSEEVDWEASPTVVAGQVGHDSPAVTAGHVGHNSTALVAGQDEQNSPSVVAGEVGLCSPEFLQVSIRATDWAWQKVEATCRTDAFLPRPSCSCPPRSCTTSFWQEPRHCPP